MTTGYGLEIKKDITGHHVVGNHQCTQDLGLDASFQVGAWDQSSLRPVRYWTCDKVVVVELSGATLQLITDDLSSRRMVPFCRLSAVAKRLNTMLLTVLKVFRWC